MYIEERCQRTDGQTEKDVSRVIWTQRQSGGALGDGEEGKDIKLLQCRTCVLSNPTTNTRAAESDSEQMTTQIQKTPRDEQTQESCSLSEDELHVWFSSKGARFYGFVLRTPRDPNTIRYGTSFEINLSDSTRG